MVFMEYGKPPKSGWARLAPELLVDDLETSKTFWVTLVGFEIAYERPEQGFAYLEHPDGAQIMLSARSGDWETGPMEVPFGRGVMLQIVVDDLEGIVDRLRRSAVPLLAEPRDVWRRWGDRLGGRREIMLQDPDGYLLMIAEQIGERPLEG